MKNYYAFLTGLLALAGALAAPTAHAAPLYNEPLTGWVVHSLLGSAPAATSGLGTNSPSFDTRHGGGSTNNGITVMADFGGGMFPFGDSIKLHKDGDYIKASTTVTMVGREVGGTAFLNGNLRIGLYNGPNASVSAGDGPHVGIINGYANTDHNPFGNNGVRVEQRSSNAGANPMNGGTATLVGNGTSIAPANSLQGSETTATPWNVAPAATFELVITRNANKLDVTGSIIRTSAPAGTLATYSILGYDPGAGLLDANGNFTFNRMGFFLGNGVRGNSTLGNVRIETNVPEPATAGLALVALVGGALMRRRGR